MFFSRHQYYAAIVINIVIIIICAQQGEYDVNGVRKSVRKRKPTRPKSPETEIHSFLKKKKQRRPAHVIVQAQTPSNSNGEPFRCDLCNSPYVTNPSRRGNRPKTSTNQPSPRHKRDPNTGRMLTLCNACGMAKKLFFMLLELLSYVNDCN